MTLRQIGILGVWPAALDDGPLLDNIFLPQKRVLEGVGLLTVAMDIPCRRRAPVLQRVWAETADETSDLALIENVVARLNALSQVGPVTIITFGGMLRDWPALKFSALRAGAPLGALAGLSASSGATLGEQRIEIVDLALWLGGPSHSIRIGSPFMGAGESDRREAVSAKTAQLYRVFLRYLAVTGRMSSGIYSAADHAAGSEIRRLRNRFDRTRPKSSF